MSAFYDAILGELRTRDVVDAGDINGAFVHTTPIQSPNGSVATFTTPSNYVAGTLVVFLNGLLEGFATESSSNTFSFPEAPHTGDVIRILYQSI